MFFDVVVVFIVVHARLCCCCYQDNDDDECHSQIDNCIDLDNFDDDSQCRGRANCNQIASQVRTVDRNKGGIRKLSSSLMASAVI